MSSESLEDKQEAPEHEVSKAEEHLKPVVEEEEDARNSLCPDTGFIS